MVNKKKHKGRYLRRVSFLLLLLLMTTSMIWAQHTVRGTVTDVSNEPLIGVSVKVKDTTIGTATDLDGNYTLSVANNAVLVFSFLGYKTVEVPVNSQSKVNIMLHEDSQALSEVVVVGYNTIRRESLTGALQTVESAKLLDTTAPVVENLLTGKAPGVYVNSSGGQPGEAAKIIIRGKSTVNGSTDPLWVVDGVIMGNSASDINPADIETLTVLKDAASTAVYGSQGANGVILVTTKKGKMGKTTVNVSAKLVATTLNTGRFELMNGSDLYDLYNSFSNPEDFSDTWWWGEGEALRKRNYDWWDNGSQTGFAQDYNVSVSGGNEKIKTYVSVGLYDETGAVKGYDYTRYNTLMKLEYKITDWFTLKPQIIASMKDIDDKQHDVGAMYRNLPWDSPYKEDGSLVGNSPNPTWVKTTGSNYLYDLQWNFTKSKTYEVMGNFDFDIRITDWLTFASVNSYKFSDKNEDTYEDPRSGSGMAANGRVIEKTARYNRLYTNQLLRINKHFDKHYINAVLGYEWNEGKFRNSQAKSTGIAPGFEVGSVAAKPEQAISWRNDWAVQSYLSNINYSYDDKYMAQFSLRRDGASNFGNNTRYGTFFSISGGWNIHREDFFKVEAINNLKLRASYGSVGNRPHEYYPHYELYALATGDKTNPKPNSYNGTPAAYITQLANADLGWEKSYVAGVGLDVSFLNRVNVTLDYYHKKTSDLLYKVPLPGVTGVTDIWRNEGEMTNKGFEANVSVDIINNKDWYWNFETNIGFNKNEVTKLYGENSRIIVGDGSGIAGSASKIVTPGKDADTWYLPEWAGVDPTNGSPLWYKTDASGNRVTTSKYSEADQVAIGKYTPDFFGGFSTNLTYKNFDLSANFNYSVGGKIYNYMRLEFDSDGAYTDRNQMKLHNGWNRWEKEGDIATHPKATYSNKSNSNKASSRFLETGTYLKMRNLTIGYNLKLPQWHIQNLKIFASGENLFTITHFSGVDPEIPPALDKNTGVYKITGTAVNTYPSTRKFVFGINVTL
ncbi:MAG: TonB-dependent receptor [Dysgonomonas sp.]|nr:TonB-dependent receptor [Dysgonomonas sp.]